MTSTQNVSSIPRSLYWMYVGIVPPPNSIVKVIRNVMILRPGSSVWLSANAANDVTIRLISVPTAVRAMVIL